MPIILLAIAGNRLVVSTAIFTNRIYADELLSIKLHLGSHGSDNVRRVARVFMAINKATIELRKLYEFPPTNSLPQIGAMWPGPTLDPPQSTTKLPELEFFSKINRANGTALQIINEDNERHAMYLARMKIGTSGDQDVVFVKFAVNYNEYAHRLLAQHNLAPALHFCARVVGDMYMVVMEYIPKARGRDLHSATSDSPPLEVAPAVVERDVTKALKLLHDEKLVFGDLREINMLYLTERGGRVLLVDFDGVGRDGEDTFSCSLNPETGLGVDRGQVMEQAHDNENLNRLMKRLVEKIGAPGM